LEEGGKFSVKSSYKKLEELLILEDKWNEDEKKAFGDIWKSKAPTKVVAFSWKLLLDRIPSKWNLKIRNVLPPENSTRSVLCGIEEETSKHCDKVTIVWEKVMRWVEIYFITPPNLFVHWECWKTGGRTKRIRQGLSIIWHATIWGIWRVRNNIIFNNEELDVEAMVEDIKVLSWRWVLNSLKIPTCLYYEWSWNPNDCLSRK